MSTTPSTPADPVTPATALVRAGWAAALGRDDFGDEDDFFAVGGHSLLVARIMAGIGRQVGTRLPLRMFFDHPTVADLARALTARGLVPAEEKEDGAS
ncbi:acyl carrier protein [Streptomyces sp. SP17BM10]|uniref:acyl carrier protein n=1 Tax=Streptomyces sp. SP17BM10 TaxID=3002530 RepID=UPI002E790C3C|nr:acyl carrier protein [Streptomyces sp. SP17BM10]MEE1784459.1 acyl carrier protein [Streptomyces sp. SP17BM10]